MTRTQPSNKDSRNDLGKSEKATLNLYLKGYTTTNELAQKRNLSQSTIRNHLASLRRKGYLGIIPGHKTDVPPLYAPNSSNKNYRLHGEEYNVKIINSSSTYQRAFKRGSDVVIDGNRVRLYRDSFEVYSGHDFWGVDPVDAERQSSEYWNRFFHRLEHTFNILLVKPGRHNIKRVKVHVAEVGNELAQQSNVEKERIRVRGVDGREWLLADASFGFDELETVHSERAVGDMQDVVMPFFNDLRDNGVTLPSVMVREAAELRGVVFELGKSIQVTQQQLQTLIALVSPPKSSDGFVDSTLADYFG